MSAQIEVTGLLQTHPEILQALSRASAHGGFATRTNRAVLDGDWLPVASFGDEVRPGWFVSRSTPGADVLATGSRVFWSAPRRLLMDRATSWVRLPEYRERATSIGGSAATGRGVVLGFVDSGVDFAHPDLQNADGTTRVEWLIDFGAGPWGIHPELEQRYGCTGGGAATCGVLSANEIDAMLAGGRLVDAVGRYVTLPTDRLGHGTHVATLAAGSGRSDPRYAGIAPEASLIVARVADAEIGVSDAGVLLATRFIFEQAETMGMPAVVNLSLGGDFGPHDGSASIAAALEAQLEVPGRAVVVSAGNSGSLFTADGLPYPGPFGIHTEVHLGRDGSARVPLLLPSGRRALYGAIFVWVGTRAGDEVSVGVERADGRAVIDAVAPGGAVAVGDGRREFIVINRTLVEDLPEVADLEQGAALVAVGEFEPGSVWAVRLSGSGSAELWVQSEGELSSMYGEGVLLPGANRAGTITIPAASPGLLAVGATLNRTVWPSRAGGQAELVDIGTALGLVPGSPAFFSSQGPNQQGRMKPDVLAPGLAVVGAMSAAADPLLGGAVNELSIFTESALCLELGCAVVDDRYAVGIGTSMAAPVVAGAVALLLEKNPGLDQREILRVVQAGSRQLPASSRATAQAEPGLLDVVTNAEVLDAYSGELAPGRPSSEHSWLALSDALARPDPSWELTGRLHLRDEHGELADVARPERELALEIEHGRVLGRLRREVPGMVEFSFAADPGSAGEQLSIAVRFEGRLLTQRTLPIGLDPNVAARGMTLRGGCAVTKTERGDASGLGLLGAWLAVCAWRRRRRA